MALFCVVSIYLYQLLFLKYVTCQYCEFRIGGVSYLSGSLHTLGQSIASGYKMAMYDYSQLDLYNMEYFTSHISSLNNGNQTCTLSMDLRDMETDIKVGIVEIFSLSSTYDQCTADNEDDSKQCTINMPFVVGPAASGHCLTTNPLIEAFNLLQFSPSATSTFLSSYNSFYRPIPSDDIQAKALIDLCHYFNWDILGILYINTDYGTSLQRAITSYANNKNIKTTTFSYISEDNVTLTDAVEAMYESNIFIFVLIVYDNDAILLSELLTKYSMYQYPFYYIGTDAWLYNSQFTWPQYLGLYGGMVGSCPWSPSINDPLYELYPYPLNISLTMYSTFYEKWIKLQKQQKYDVTFNISEPGLFTIYAYDVMLTIIKIIDQYIDKYNISTINEFWNKIYNSSSTIDEFKVILAEIWFIGLSGNVSYGEGFGDRSGGLFSFCNVNPETGDIVQIGFSFGDEIIVNEENIIWPLHSYSVDIPQTAYISYNGISSQSGSILPVIIWIFIFLSMLLTIIYLFLVYYYRKRKIIMASQWKLSLFMAFGCIICYIALILFGIDESFPVDNKLDYNWSALCNSRLLLLNLSFSLIFGPLFTKIYRIKKIFTVAFLKLQKITISDKKMFIYNVVFISIDSILCIILLLTIPYDREYRNGAIINYATTQWGSCTVNSSGGYIYFIILGLPKLIFSLYCIILSISVYSTVSMMKFNEGLQVLICMVISVLLIFITLLIASVITINSASSSIFFYGFISFLLLMVCNFCCAVMILPRLFSIWKGYDEEEYINDNNEVNAVKKYMKTLRSNLNNYKLSTVNALNTFNSQTDRDQTMDRLSSPVSLEFINNSQTNLSNLTNNTSNNASDPRPDKKQKQKQEKQKNVDTLQSPRSYLEDVVSDTKEDDDDDDDEGNEENDDKKNKTNNIGIKGINIVNIDYNTDSDQHHITDDDDDNDNHDGYHQDILMTPSDTKIIFNNNPRLSTRL